MKKQNKYKAVIFDLDGTLLDTLDDLSDSLNYVLQNNGFSTHSKEKIKYFIGDGAYKLIERALPTDKRDNTFVQKNLEEFIKVYSNNSNHKTKLYDGIPELLDALTLKNINISILTNKPQASTDLCVKEFFSSWKFSMIMGQVKGQPVKPDPIGAITISNKIGFPTDKFIFVGDSDVDMKTAISSGMLPVGVKWGFRTETELIESGARKVIEHPKELLRFI